MPPLPKHDKTQSLFYAIITHLGAPSADDKAQWQKIADLLPNKPWGDSVFDSWNKVQRRAEKEGWLASKNSDGDEKKFGADRNDSCEETKEGKTKRKSLEEVAGALDAKVPRTRSRKRTRSSKNVAWIESSEEEVSAVNKGKKVVERKIAGLRRSGAVLRRPKTLKTTRSKGREKEAVVFEEKLEESSSDSDLILEGGLPMRKAFREKEVFKGSIPQRLKAKLMVGAEKERDDEILDDED